MHTSPTMQPSLAVAHLNVTIHSPGVYHDKRPLFLQIKNVPASLGIFLLFAFLSSFVEFWPLSFLI